MPAQLCGKKWKKKKSIDSNWKCQKYDKHGLFMGIIFSKHWQHDIVSSESSIYVRHRSKLGHFNF